MATDPLVSIIVPLYNKERYIAQTLESVLQQSDTDWECIVVDDGSTDRGPERVAAYEDERIRLIRQANAGPAAARNHGAREARGEWLLFLDADDELMSDNIEVGRNLLSRFPATNVYLYRHHCQYKSEPEPIVDEGRPFPFEYTLDSSRVRAEDLTFIANRFEAGAAWIRRRTFGSFTGYYDRQKILFGEDTYLWVQVVLTEPFLVSDYVGVWVNVASSELGVGKKGKFNSAVLLDPEGLFEAVPPEHHELLRSFIDRSAYRFYNQRMLYGKYQAALRLRCRFPNLDRHAQRDLFPAYWDVLYMLQYKSVRNTKRFIRWLLGRS